jgi:hypothetical protein
MEIELDPGDLDPTTGEDLLAAHFVRQGYPKISPKFVKAVRVVTGEANPYETIKELLISMCGSDPVVDSTNDWWVEEYGPSVDSFRAGYKKMVNEALELLKIECKTGIEVKKKKTAIISSRRRR